MLKRLKRMQNLVELAQDELEKASVILRSVQQQLTLQQSQLDSLKSYQAEYIGQLTRKESTTLHQLNTTQAFLDKLNSAIDHQVTEITRLNEAILFAENSWVNFKSREQSLVKLHEKIKKNHQAKMDKAEQRMLDDLSSRYFYLNNQSDD